MFFSNIQNCEIRKAFRVVMLLAFILLVAMVANFSHQNRQLSDRITLLEDAVPLEAPPAVQFVVEYDDAAILAKLDEQGNRLENTISYLTEGVPIFTATMFDDFALQLEAAGVEPRALVRYYSEVEEQLNGDWIWPAGSEVIREYVYNDGTKSFIVSVPAGSTVTLRDPYNSGEIIRVDVEAFGFYIFAMGQVNMCHFGPGYRESCITVFSYDTDI